MHWLTLLRWSAPALVLFACSPPAAAPEAPTKTPAPATSKTTTAEPPTRYRVGDYVEYLYSGSALPAPVKLKEQITLQEGNRLRIEVEASREGEISRWIQVVIDTPENRENEVIAELYEVRDGSPVRLDNESNRDVYRLYAWTIPPLKAKPRFVAREARQMSFGGTSFQCSVEKSELEQDGAVLALEFATCDDFLWNNGPAEIRNTTTGELVWRREPVQFGQDPSR
jgi:predicted DNA-binding antitoxin AbrB/MazE fold protein